MKKVRWLVAIAGVLAVAAIWTFAEVSGDSGRDKELKDWRRGDGKIKHPELKGPLGEELERNRFVDKPVVVYRTPGGEQLFALQLQPRLADAPAQPTDYLVVIDTSASKAPQGNLIAAAQVVDELAKKIGPDDRVAVWTANLKARDVSRGFKGGKELDAAIKELVKEVPLGAVNLKRCLSEAINSFEARAGRRRAVVYLGDGKSVAEPVDTDGRAELCEQMIRKQAAFFAVPLGLDLDAQNLHGLVSGTGGKVLRSGPAELAQTFIVRLLQDVAEPVCYPETFKLPPAVTAALPTRLPPLRRDTSTLVVGKVAADTAVIDYKLSGEVAGKLVQLDQVVPVPAADPENYFLTTVFDQWKARKDRPALLQGDRALAYAHKQNQLAVEDLIARAEMALEENRLDLAQRIFEQAEGIDPNSARARGGILLVEKMRTGKKTRQDMLKELQLNAAKREVVRLTEGGRKIVVLDEGDERPEEPRPADDPARRDPLDDVKARRAIAEQQATGLVNEAIRQARRRVRTNPDEAYETLKRARDEVQSNVDLEQRAITGLTGRLTREMESINRIRDIVKRDQAEALALRAAADARLEVRNAERIAQERVRERMRIYHNLMDQAREEEAQRQAILMRDEMVNRGQPIPPAVTAAYQIAQSRYYLKEVQELRRLREDRFLATMLEVERSHVPFPDEPPVVFPDSAIIRRLTRNRFDNWRDWSKYRIEKYSVSTFGADRPGELNRLRTLMNEKFDYGGLDDPKATLYEALDQLKKGIVSKLPGGRDVDFDVNEKAFKYEMLNDVLKTEVANPNPIPRMENVTLATVLKRILAKVPVPSGATYILRPNTIEITTGQFATAEKAVRVYPVADLVVPIPSAYNQQQVGATATILGSLGQMGLAGGIQLGALGAGGLQLGLALGGALGALGGALGALGGALGVGGGLALGALGGGLAGGLAGGLQAGAVGLGGMQAGGPAGMQLGGFNFQGNVNMGVGGGMAGFTGGQLGQLGNLGGQFGLQGGTQEQLLITLIRQVVGRPKDWAPQYNPITGQPLNPLDDQMTEGTATIAGQDNNLGYYPPSMALVVKAPSMVHTRASNLIITGAAGAAAGQVAAPKDNGGKAVVGDKGPKGKPLDPKKVWEDALVKGVSDPGLIIATSDYLGSIGRFDHAAEFLKSNLRQGIVVRPWVYKALAAALRESGGSAEEIERAEVSAADLEPLNASGYLTAARALAEDRNYERALAFCKQAAQLEPNVPVPYADAARYAEMARDVKAMGWAVSHLLRQDWPVQNQELQQTALERLESLARRVDPTDAGRLRQEVAQQRRRDLVVKLLWQGEADLDLKVHEPTGSLCTPLARQTVGGGTLIADTISDGNNSETYVAAEAFSGDYVILVERIWGKPQGNKAQLKIIRNQGTPEESEQLVTLKMASNISEPVKVTLDNGRRTETAYVPPAGAYQPLEEGTGLDSGDQVLNKLRALADPEVTETIEKGIRGDTLSSGWRGERSLRPTPTKPSENDRTVYQNKVTSFVSNSAELTAQAVLAADRQSLRLSVNPVYNPAAASKPARVVSPVFPGAK